MGDDYTFTVKGAPGVAELNWQPIVFTGPSGHSTTANKITNKEDPTVSDVFRPRAKAEEAFKAVKLTEDNLRAVAADMLRKVGGRVEVVEGDSLKGYGLTKGSIALPRAGWAQVGQWVVEEFNFEFDRVEFRVATVDERKAHNLR